MIYYDIVPLMALLFARPIPNICTAFQLAVSIRKVYHLKQSRRVLNIPSKATVQFNSLNKLATTIVPIYCTFKFLRARISSAFGLFAGSPSWRDTLHNGSGASTPTRRQGVPE